MNGKKCVLCGADIEWQYYVLPFGFICYDCGEKIIEHLKIVTDGASAPIKEKRFRVEDIEEELYPMPVYYDNDKLMDYTEIVDILNGLYEENKEYTDIINRILLSTDLEQSYSTPVCRITVQVSPKIYELLTELIKER